MRITNPLIYLQITLNLVPFESEVGLPTEPLSKEPLSKELLPKELMSKELLQKSVIIIFEKTHHGISIKIKDRGIGISNPDNLFVPFYTTKQQGQGIGLFFCRNIIEKYGGKLSLKSRNQGGAQALIQLPIAKCFGNLNLSDSD